MGAPVSSAFVSRALADETIFERSRRASRHDEAVAAACNGPQRLTLRLASRSATSGIDFSEMLLLVARHVSKLRVRSASQFTIRPLNRITRTRRAQAVASSPSTHDFSDLTPSGGIPIAALSNVSTV